MWGSAREEIGHNMDSIEAEIRSGKGIRASVRICGVERRRQEFTEFYTSSRDDCLRIVLVSVGDRQLAEDLVAEAFTRAWTSWRTVREHPVPRAWVVRTALNTHVSWWRRRRRELTVDGRTALTLLDATQLGPSADPDLDEGLAAAVRALPARQREVITLRVFFDLDTDATAKLLGISAGTVGAHLHRALAALRTQIQSFSDQGVTR
jgi:RNA polymerase sigma-70 factor (sigma-E family)